MKVFIVLASFVVAASAGHLYGAAPLAGALNQGSSSQFRSEDNYGNYQFGYDESHATGGSSRREEETNGVRRGSYSLSDADGRRRVVNYIADASGFHADIQTNEPGVESKDPADVQINKNGHGPIAGPAPVLAAPAPILAAPAPIWSASAVKGHAGPIAPVVPLLAGPVKTYAPIAAPEPVYAAPEVFEAPTPRAFSYAFSSAHSAPTPLVAAVAHAPAQVVTGPIFQQRLGY